MALIMGLGMTGVQGEDNKTVYASSFIAGEDGWFARGAERIYRTTEGTLRTEGRTSNWHSPGHNFELVGGNQYDLSVEVLQTEAEQAEFMISVAHSKDGAETYENIAKGTAEKDTWTKIEGSWNAGDFDTYVLYVETTGTPELSFEIRNFRVIAPNGIPTPKPTEAPMTIAEADGEIPVLKDVYADAFDIGTCIPAGLIRMGHMNKKEIALVKTQYNILTPENELKPDAVLDVSASSKLAKEDETAVAVHFSSAKPIMDFAKANGMKMHGHVLVWHSQTPEAFFHEGYDLKKPLVTREIMLARLENYIREVMTWTNENYPGLIVSWDVVNEAIDDGTNWLRKTSKWVQVVGEDFVARAFEYARKYAPEGVQLYYNDYNACFSGKLNGIIKLMNTVIPDGNIDGFGFQMHHKSGMPSYNDISRSVDRVAKMGLKIRVSELDVGITNATEASYRAQAKKYAEVMQVLLAHKDQVEAVQVWGVSDKFSWRKNERPLPFDEAGNPKPAFYAMADPEAEIR